MRTLTRAAAALLAAFGLVNLASATVYTGNGNNGFGGPVGQGSLNLTNSGTNVSGTLTKGPGDFNDVLVLYVDSVAGGIGDTSVLNDAGDGLRRAISGFDGSTNRSTLTFPSGFAPDYAIALGPSAESFGGVWQLTANSGNNGLPFVSSANLTPTGGGSASAPTFNFSFDAAQLGVAPGGSFNLLGTYISNSGYRSNEALPGNVTGDQGWNAFTSNAPGTYSLPEPGSMALLAVPAAALLRRRRRRGPCGNE
jgi:hypothetical protein